MEAARTQRPPYPVTTATHLARILPGEQRGGVLQHLDLSDDVVLAELHLAIWIACFHLEEGEKNQSDSSLRNAGYLIWSRGMIR